jgi:uncharacterized membrane protein
VARLLLQSDGMAATSFETFMPHWPRSLEFSGSAGSFVPPSRFFVWSLRILCAVALSITGYLAFTALRSEDVAGCGSGVYFDCSHVLHSRWSKILTLPVSVPAFALYALMFAALLVCGQPGIRSRLAWATITVGAFAAGVVAFWFAGLQLFSVGHLCIYCIAAHSCGVALCLAIAVKAPLGARATAKLSAASLLGVSAFIAAQVFSAPPPTYKVEHFPVPAMKSASTPAAANSVHKSKPEKSRAPEVFEPPPGT